MDYKKFMRIALEESDVSKKEGDRAFAAILVKDNKVVGKAHNRVLTTNDPTSHAEINLIRKFCTKNSISDLDGYTIYSICEPCPMCASAIVWANISTIVYGCDGADGPTDYDRQNKISCEEVVNQSGKKIKLIKHILADKCKRSLS